MNKKQEIIYKILSLPETFKKSDNNKSFKELLNDTGYFEIADQIQEKELFNAVRENPKFITDWINWSDDKRTTSGWFIKESEKGKYTVSFFPKKDELTTFKTDDVKIACAHFIQREIESLIG